VTRFANGRAFVAGRPTETVDVPQVWCEAYGASSAPTRLRLSAPPPPRRSARQKAPRQKKTNISPRLSARSPRSPIARSRRRYEYRGCETAKKNAYPTNALDLRTADLDRIP